MSTAQLRKTWETICKKLDPMRCAQGNVEIETPNGLRIYRSIDDALDGGDPIAETVFEGEELAAWQGFYRGQAFLPNRAEFDVEPLRELLADPQATARQLTDRINRQVAELLPALIHFLKNAEGPAVAVLRGARFSRSLWLYRDGEDEANARLPLSRLNAALLELLAAYQTLPD